MPQDKRRSISYKSFVTCDDPRGVVECGAIRKSSKISSQKKHNKNPTSSSSLAVIKEQKKEMAIVGITRECETSTSFELQEVSKSTNKLNHVIKKGHHQKDIASDLLKGALDLQESLAVLKEASSYISRVRRKEKERVEEEGRFDAMVNGLMGVDRFGYLQDKPRSSLDGSSRKSFDGLKNVVRDSLLRQNVITNPIFEEHFDHRKMGSPDLPSTSSSWQSSMVHSSTIALSDSSTSSITSRKKKGSSSSGSNLIVKLMGLESLPSSPRRYKDGEKFVNLAKPIYDVDSPIRAKKPQFGCYELGMTTKQRSVDEILETLNFKGLLRSNSLHGLMCSSPPSTCSEVSHSYDQYIDQRPPIVLMKPMRFPCIDHEEVMKPRSRRELSRDSVNCETESFGEMLKEVEGSKSMKKVAVSKVKVAENLHQKAQKKQENMKKVSEVVKVTPSSRRKGEEKTVRKPSDELRYRDQAKLSSSSKMKRQKDGVFVSKNQNFSQKNRQPVVVGENRRHKGESKESKARYKEKIGSISEDDSELLTVDSMVVVVDDFCSVKQADTSENQIIDYNLDNQTPLSDARENTANLRINKETFIRDLLPVVNHDYGNQSSLSDITSTSIDEIQSPLREVTLITTHENGVAVHLDHHLRHEDEITLLPREPSSETPRKSLTPRMKLKSLLLRSQSFVSRVEELFNIQVNPELFSHFDNDTNPDLESDGLLLDCANELLEQRSSKCSQACLLSPLINQTNPRNSLSLDRLLDDICNGIEDLRWSFSSENLYLFLERDLMCKSGGIWEIGWKNAFSQDEVEKVVGDVDKLVLGKLIEEVIADFLRCS